MQVDTSRVASSLAVIGGAHRADPCSCRYGLANAHGWLSGQVPVFTREAARVPDFDTIAVSAAPAGLADGAIARRDDRRPLVVGNVDAVMEVPAAEIAIAEA